MDESNLNEKQITQDYEEIDLRELITALWKRKIFIIAVTLVLAVLAGLYSNFMIEPTYSTKMHIIVSMPNIFDTEYGEYTLPITSNGQFVNFITSDEVLSKTIEDSKDHTNLSASALKNNIVIEQDTSKDNSQTNYTVKVSALDPDEPLILANNLFNNYKDYLDVMLNERAIIFFDSAYEVKLRELNDEVEIFNENLKTNEELLEATPQVINQQVQSSSILSIQEVTNPNYLVLENDIIQNKKDIKNAETLIKQYTRYLEELGNKKVALNANKYHVDDDARVTDVVDVNIYMSSELSAPTLKSSTNVKKNVVLAGILGFIMSVIIALFHAYWKKEI